MAALRLARWRLGLGVMRGAQRYGKRYSDNAPSRGAVYTAELAEATVSLSSKWPLPVYRVMSGTGEVLQPEQDPGVSSDVSRSGSKVTLFWSTATRRDISEDV